MLQDRENHAHLHENKYCISNLVKIKRKEILKVGQKLNIFASHSLDSFSSVFTSIQPTKLR